MAKRYGPVVKRTPDQPCDWHKPSGLGYMEWHADAEKRAAAGEKQKKCKDCGRYFWPHEYGEKPKPRKPDDSANQV